MTVLLRLTPDVARHLRQVLETVEHLDEGADVGPALGPDGWGDLGRFRRQVSDPLRRPMRVPAPSIVEQDEITAIELDDDEASVLGGVVKDASVGFSTGRPWLALNPHERAVIARIICRLTP
jgi:hypothetical protein